jgi:hypothetical protein
MSMVLCVGIIIDRVLKRSELINYIHTVKFLRKIMTSEPSMSNLRSSLLEPSETLRALKDLRTAYLDYHQYSIPILFPQKYSAPPAVTLKNLDLLKSCVVALDLARSPKSDAENNASS